MIKIAHESPNSTFKEIQKLTDYDYALVNLYRENEEYRNHFLEAKEMGREIILDNSIFELETAWNPSDYVKVIEELKPDWYIVPDVLEDYKGTCISYRDFISKYPGLPGKKIGVLQGKTYEELVECYTKLIYYGVDKVAISFDYSYYLTIQAEYFSKPIRYMKGRQSFLDMFFISKEFCRNPKPIHLLGSYLPQEGQYYRDKPYRKYIESIDTSNPIVHGLKGIRYKEGEGLWSKETQKLFTLIEEKVSSKQLEDIQYNISQFKNYWNG